MSHEQETLPTLPTSVVGSHGLPGLVHLAREAMDAGRLGAIDLRELWEDATQAALLDQERAGVDVEAPRWVTKAKLHALVEGARLVRMELEQEESR